MRFSPLSELMDKKPPLVEGKCPPKLSKNGNWYYPKPLKKKDPEIRDEENYSVKDRDEFWDYVTVCKKCGTEFIAEERDENGYLTRTVRNYCPGCGERLVSE